jgi:glycosyltransferase involved in cell wall biosynthesis
MPSFSIIIPFKTGKAYLMECIQSALKQNYTDFNVIILADITSNDDGSLEAVAQINDTRLSVVNSENNLNILENWDRIKQINRQEYMTILGYDDILHPNFLTTIVGLMQEHPNASLYHTHFHYISASGEQMKPCLPLPKKLSANDYVELSLQDKVSVMATGYVFKSKDYDAVGGIPIYYPNLIYADLFLWIELSKIAYLAVSPEYCFSFRIHHSTTKTSKDKLLLNAFVVYLHYLKKLSEENAEFKQTIRNWLPSLLNNTTRAMAHRLLRTEKAYRDGLTMEQIFHTIAQIAEQMNIVYHPMEIPTMKMTVWIDHSSIVHRLFLIFKKLYKKPIY